MKFEWGKNPKSRNGFKKGHKGTKFWVGKSKSEDHKKKIKETLKRKHKTGEIKNSESIFKKGHKNSEIAKKKMGEQAKKRIGDKSANWRGGITPLNMKIRNSLEYRLWRKAVFERDKDKCIWCGSNKEIQADHIKPFALFPELRFAIDNGRTLCEDCHRNTNTWGGNSKITKGREI